MTIIQIHYQYFIILLHLCFFSMHKYFKQMSQNSYHFTSKYIIQYASLKSMDIFLHGYNAIITPNFGNN